MTDYLGPFVINAASYSFQSIPFLGSLIQKKLKWQII